MTFKQIKIENLNNPLYKKQKCKKTIVLKK